MLSEQDIRNRLHPLSPLPTGVQPKGGRLPPIHCVLFDIYGTLFISASGDIGIAKGSETSLRQLGLLLDRYDIEMPPDELLQRFYRAIETDHQTSRSAGIEFPEVDIIRIWQDVLPGTTEEQVRDFAVEFEILSNPTYPMPNLTEVLTACRKSAARMGLISNAQFYTPLLFNWFLGADIDRLGFDPRLVFFSFQHGRAKPGKYLYQLAGEALRQIMIQPSSVLYVGNDMRNDIHPAKQAGFRTALFAGDARSLRMREDEPICSALEPDLVVTDLNQLISYLPPSI